MSDKKRKLLNGLIIAVCGAFATILLSSLHSYVFERANPRILEFTVELEQPNPFTAVRDPFVGDENRLVTPLKQLIENSEENDWIAIYPETIKRERYIGQLRADREEMIDLLSGIDQLKVALENWPDDLIKKPEERAKSIFRLLWANQSAILGYVYGNVRRGNQIFNEPISLEAEFYSLESKLRAEPAQWSNDPDFVMRYEELRSQIPAPLINLRVDEDGDFYISLAKRNFPITWSVVDKQTFKANTDNLREAASRLCVAIAYGGTDDLKVVKTHLVSMCEQDTTNTLRKTLNLIEGELVKQSNWIVRAIVENTGRLPVSIGPNAALYVKTSQYAPKTVRKGLTMASNARIDLLRAKETEIETEGVSYSIGYHRYPEPVFLQAGEAISVTFRSIPTVGGSHEFYQGLVEALDAESVDCRLLILRSDESAKFLSKDAPFKLLYGEERFPDETKVWSQ